MSFARLLVLLAVAVLVGCETAPKMKEPETGPRARVRFVAKSAPGVLFKYSDAMCRNSEGAALKIFPDSWSDEQARRIGVPLWDYKAAEAQEYFLEAGTTFYGVFEAFRDMGTVNISCNSPFALTPKAGHDYEVEFLFEKGACGAVVREIIPSGAMSYSKIDLQPIPLARGGCDERYSTFAERNRGSSP